MKKETRYKAGFLWLIAIYLTLIRSGCAPFMTFRFGASSRGNLNAFLDALVYIGSVTLFGLLLLRLCSRGNAQHSNYCEQFDHSYPPKMDNAQ